MTNRHWYENLAEIIFGGNGIDRYGDGDIICHTSDNLYQMPDDVREATMVLLEDAIIEKCRNGQVFENNRQIRLKSAWITSFDSSSDGTNKPLHLDVEQTGYFATYCTNARLTDNPLITLPDSLTIGEKYAGDIRLSESRLSDPIAVNLSVVTIDGKIHVGKRSSQNAINSKAKYQPAVSGNGSIKDDIIEGNYDPFLTAIRESMEEVTGRNFRPERTMITFFGYAKTLKTRFPFLFGELRLPITSLELKALATQRKGNWEGRIEEDCVIPFTVVDVVDWISKHRNVPAIGTTLFSLYQSLIYQYPNKIGNICDRLEKEEYRERTASEETMLKIFELLVLPEMLISTKALKSVNEAAVIMIKKHPTSQSREVSDGKTQPGYRKNLIRSSSHCVAKYKTQPMTKTVKR